MKEKLLRNVVKILCFVAVLCAATPSRMNLYEPDKPQYLK